MWHCRPQGPERFPSPRARLTSARSHPGHPALPSSLPRAGGARASAPGPVGQRDLWRRGKYSSGPQQWVRRAPLSVPAAVCTHRASSRADVGSPSCQGLDEYQDLVATIWPWTAITEVRAHHMIKCVSASTVLRPPHTEPHTRASCHWEEDSLPLTDTDTVQWG